jgi:hypothetical protein
MEAYRRSGGIAPRILYLGTRGYEMDSSGSGYGPVLGSCEHGNEPSGYKRYGIS